MEPIPNFPGYFADREGNIYSDNRRGRRSKNAGNYLHKMSPRPMGNGHLRIKLYKNRKVYDYYVHRLILLTFVGPCPNSMQVLHKNDICTDNRLDNLYYGTPSDNWHDKFANYQKWKQLAIKLGVV